MAHSFNWKCFAAVSALLFIGSAAPAKAHSGHIVWGSWRFDWEVKNDAGLGIRNVYFNNRKIIYKASMPVIRVKYDCCCGPYADLISWSSLKKISNCGNEKVCTRSYTQGGRNWLEVGVYARIGAYHLYQAWYFSHDGWIRGKLWSKGLQCEVDHKHHPYWRMDFDIDGAGSDQVFVYDNNRPSEGWGNGWQKITNETNGTKNAAIERKWFVRDNSTSNGVWIFPGALDEASDSFSTKDYAPRRYHSSEDVAWIFGAWGHLGYDDGENIEQKDIIFWYVGHMSHEEEDGADEWHSVGPWIKVAQ